MHLINQEVRSIIYPLWQFMHPLPSEEMSMFIKDWKKEIFTIPNMLSMFRLALIPVYMTVYLEAQEPSQYYTAGGILAVSCLTDAVDGKIARRYNMISTLGKILDPFADKITQFTVTLCLSLKYPPLRPVLILFVVKELFQLIAGAVHLRHGRMLPGALMAGKVCTTILFLSLITLVFFPTTPRPVVQVIAAVDMLFLIISFISYIFAYVGKNQKVQDLDAK